MVVRKDLPPGKERGAGDGADALEAAMGDEVPTLASKASRRETMSPKNASRAESCFEVPLMLSAAAWISVRWEV